MAIDENRVSSLLDSLPAIFQEDREQGEPNFMGRFLLAFERILLGLGETTSSDGPVPQAGLEEIIGGGQVIFGGSDTVPVPGVSVLAGLHRYFESGFISENEFKSETESVPYDFLPWLAGWLALTLREDWDEWQKRELIAKACELYRLRGTLQGMEDFLRIYTHQEIQIDEQNTPFELGVHSQIGVDTFLDGGPPFYFDVHVTLSIADMEMRRQQYEIASAIIDLQKPAHTWYTLTVETPIFQIWDHSQVGVDTVLG